MILGWFRNRYHDAVIERLYGEIVASARNPQLYSGDYGVEDTVEGRFELIALHLILAVNRMSALEPPGRQLAQEVTDMVFRHFDTAMRELGVGDLTVPKKIKKFAEAYLGRSQAYLAALASEGDGLEQALARNVYGGKRNAAALSLYVRRCADMLAACGIETFVNGPLKFADPSLILASGGDP